MANKGKSTNRARQNSALAPLARPSEAAQPSPMASPTLQEAKHRGPVSLWLHLQIQHGLIDQLRRDPTAFDDRVACSHCATWETRGGVHHHEGRKAIRVCQSCWTIAQPIEHEGWRNASLRRRVWEAKPTTPPDDDAPEDD